MKVYIAGPMTGYTAWNHPAFQAAAKAWRDKGHVVANPAENFGGDSSLRNEDYGRADLHLLLQVEAIALLPGWHHSKHAKIEVLNGEWLGLMFFDAITLEAVAPVVTTYAEPVRQAA